MNIWNLKYLKKLDNIYSYTYSILIVILVKGIKFLWALTGISLNNVAVLLRDDVLAITLVMSGLSEASHSRVAYLNY